jgi:hypothetical protein
VTPAEALRVIASAVGARVRQDGDIYVVEPKPLPHERPHAPALGSPAVVTPAPTAAATATGDIPVGNEQVILPEIELVAYPDLACRVDQHIPQTLFTVQLTQKKNFYLGTSFFLIAV